MPQRVLLNNLITFLEQTSKAYQEDLANEKELSLLANPKEVKKINKHYQKILNEHLEHIEKMKAGLKRGHCLGLAVCHGVMDEMGFLNWWEALLADLANWDGNSKDLENLLDLPGANPVPGQPTTRQHLYERALNYIVSHALVDEYVVDTFLPKNISQQNLLAPTAHKRKSSKDKTSQQTSYAEAINFKNDVTTTKNNQKIAGYFPDADLTELLTKNIGKKNITILHSTDHAIRIYYKNHHWHLYDANDDHRKIPIAQTFEKKSDLIDEITQCFDNRSFCLEVTSFKNAKQADFSHYQKLMEESPEVLFQELGLHVIAKQTPEILENFFAGLEKINDITKINKIVKALSEALIREDDSTSGFQMLATYAPTALKILFKFTATTQNKALKQSFSDALMLHDNDNWTGFFAMINSDPKLLNELITLVDTSDEGKEIFSSIAFGLVEKETLNGNTGMQLLAKYKPDLLPKVLRLILETESDMNWLEPVLVALATENSSGKTTWETINQNSKLKKEVITILIDAIKKIDSSIAQKIKDDLDSALTNQQTHYHLLCKQPPSFLHPLRKPYGKTAIWESLYTAVKKQLKNNPSL